MEKHPNNHHHSERLEKLEAKAHEEKSVAGHPMPAADIFKFVGLIAFFVIMIVVGVALETTQQIESQMMMRHYKGFLE